MKHLVPNEIFDQHIIVLGKTRSGKSSVLRLFVEHLLGQDKPVCILDPKGDWWGLKASADGKKAGFPVVIFGGPHGDVPLNARSGAAVAELVATGNRPSIIDLGGWMPGERTQFYIDFASTFFLKTRGRRWLVIDEVHNFCFKGKVMSPEAGKMLHWSNRLASEGLGKGVALLAASQRPQKVHNDFLTSCETLVAMRVIHPSDREAISDWIDGCADEEKAGDVLSSLASMKRGEAWVWSPEAEFGPKRIQFPMFETYDSFKARTSEESVKLKGWADVDLAEVTKKLEVVVKEAEAKDPAKLQARVRELERELQTEKRKSDKVGHSPAAVSKSLDPRIVDRAVAPFRKALEDVMKIIVRVEAFGTLAHLKDEELTRLLDTVKNEVKKLASARLAGRDREMAALQRDVKALKARTEQLLKEAGSKIQIDVVATSPVNSALVHSRGSVVSSDRAAPPLPPPSSNGGGEFTKPQLRVLAALAEFAGIGIKAPSRSMVASWLGVKAGTGSFKNYLSELRARGLIADPKADCIALTEKGMARAPQVEAVVTTEELLKRAESVMGRTAASILKIAHRRYPEYVRRETIAEDLGISAETGSFKNYISELRTAGMIEDGPEKSVKAAEWLFL